MTQEEFARIAAPLRVDQPERAHWIGRELIAKGYTGDEMRRLVPESGVATTSAKMDQAAIAERLGTGSAQACLLRVFLLRAPVEEPVLRERIGEELFIACEEMGLWERIAGGIVGAAVFLEDEGTFILSDHTRVRHGELEMYWVMSVGTSTVTLADSVERKPYGRLLDLCCGSGVQGFYLAKLSESVLGLDRNPRALNFGRFGAAMSGLGNVEFAESDRYSAAEGKQFDLLICNPPYVMTPDRQAYYRDGGMGGDRFSEGILREGGKYLAENGRMHVVCDVGTIGGRLGVERLQSWLEGNGCDVVALGGRRLDPAEYAEAWLQHEDRAFAATEVPRWVENFAALEIEEIRNWVLILRKRTAGGPNWFHVEDMPSKRNRYFGNQVGRMFAAQDLLRRPEAAFWEARFALAPEVLLQQTMRPAGNRWMGDSARITFAEGLQSEYEVDPRTAPMLLLFDGNRSNGEVLERVATANGANAEEMREGWEAYLRHLVENLILGVVD